MNKLLTKKQKGKMNEKTQHEHFSKTCFHDWDEFNTLLIVPRAESNRTRQFLQSKQHVVLDSVAAWTGR